MGLKDFLHYPFWFFFYIFIVVWVHESIHVIHIWWTGYEVVGVMFYVVPETLKDPISATIYYGDPIPYGEFIATVGSILFVATTSRWYYNKIL